MYRKPFCIAFFLLVLPCLLPGGFFVHAGVKISDYSVSHYSNENGLPQNSVKAIACDEYGFIWMATEAGLCRFDGRHFYLFNKFNAGIVSSRIVDIWRSPVTGGLHALTEKWSMLRISKGNISIENKKWQDLYRRISPYTQTSSILHYTWRYRRWLDPYHLDSLQLNLSDKQTVLLNFKGSVKWFKDGKLTGQQNVPSFDKFNVSFVIDSSLYRLDPNPQTDAVTRIMPDKLVTIRLKGDILNQAAAGERFLCLNQSSAQVFIYSNECFYLVEKQKDGNLTTHLLLEGFDFEKLKISSGYYDTVNKRIFLGSHTNGLYVFSRKTFFTRTHGKESNADNIFYDLIPYSDTSVLTGKGILFYTNSNQNKLFNQIELTHSVIGSILYRTADSTIWTTDRTCVYQFTKDGYHIISKWQVPGVTAITRVSSGDLWLGTDKRGIYAIKPDHPEMPARLLYSNLDYVGCIQQENNDIVWIGTENQLLRCRLSAGKLDTIRQLDYKVVRGVYVSRPNEVWLCTYEDGLYLYRNDKLTRFPADRNRALNTVHHIAEDKKGFFWISTNNGIIQVAKNDLLQYAENNKRIPFYLHYTKNNGFNTNEFNGGGQQVGARLGDGHFSFASMDGIVFFKPEEVRPELPDAPIVIDNIELDGKQVALSDTIALEYDFANLRLRVSTPYFGNQDNVVLEYKLDKRSWAVMENETFAFNALDAGRHILIIRKKAGFYGRYNYRKIHLYVKPSFYETGLFKAICIAIVFLLIWLFMKLRLRIVNRRNKYLEQTVADRTSDLKKIINALEVSEQRLGNELLFQEKLNKNIAHDIRTPLKYLVLFSKHLYNKVDEHKMPSIDEAEGIYVSAERIYSYTDKLTVYLKARMEKDHSKSKVNLYEIAAQNGEIFMLALREKNNNFINDLPKELTIVTHQQIFDILMHNLIDNAIKNTQNGIIRISSSEHAGRMVLNIEDSGKGMTRYEADIYNKYFTDSKNDDNQQYTGFGFLIIKDILPILEINIEVQPRTEGGTIFKLYL